MNVFDLISLDDPYGLERQFYQYLRLEQETIESPPCHTVAIRRNQDPYFEDIGHFAEVFRAKYLWNILRIPKSWRPWHVCRKINSVQPDVLMCHGFHHPNYLQALPRRASFPIVFHEHGLIWHRDVPYPGFDDMDRYVANSRATRTMLEKKAGIPGDRIEIIHNNYPPDWETDGARVDNEIDHSSDGPFRCLYVGRLEPFKGIHSLLLAAERLPDSFVIEIVGDGSSRQNLQKQVEERSIENVTFLGYRENPEPLMRRSDVIVVPSVREPFGKVNVEAGLVGKPVVCSAVDGIVDVIPGPEFGYPIRPSIDPEEIPHLNREGLPDQVVSEEGNLVSPRFLDPEKLADVLREVREHPKTAQARATRLQKRVREMFHPQKYVKQMRDLYSDVANVE